ncbi:MAG TPA: glycosyltransferase [Pyrinomonadaceae bacterium]|jgi:glycosyltransferase involved in cell wall biosynthesis
MKSNPPTFSVIIPAYNEEKLLPRLLDSIAVARKSYSGGPNAVEIIVADNDSTDRTAAVAAEHGAKVEKVTKRRIAAARNGGARAASGDILCFIDADSAIHPQTFAAIEEELGKGRTVGGATGVKLERRSIGLLVTYVMVLPMIWLMRMDTGVVFCRREDFEMIGGYDETRLYAEDVLFLLALRRLGRSRGQRLGRLRGVRALGSTRKFDQFGDWHYFGMLAHVFKGLLTLKWNDEKLAERYWYKSGR